jgi:hypothetical protein
MEPQRKRIGAARARGVHARHGTAERDRQGTVPAHAFKEKTTAASLVLLLVPHGVVVGGCKAWLSGQERLPLSHEVECYTETRQGGWRGRSCCACPRRRRSAMHGGCGTTYKAVLDDISVVAVKRLRGAAPASRGEQEGVRPPVHMAVLGYLRHPNVVPLNAYYYACDENLRSCSSMNSCLTAASSPSSTTTSTSLVRLFR